MQKKRGEIHLAKETGRYGDDEGEILSMRDQAIFIKVNLYHIGEIL